MCCYGAARVSANITQAGPRIPAGSARRMGVLERGMEDQMKYTNIYNWGPEIVYER
jgi:hypothetical protein